MMLTTTLNAIRAHDPCVKGWQKLLTHLGKTVADDDPLTFATILESNGLSDALWALRCVTGYDREIRHYAVWRARQVQHLMADPRSTAALDVAERYADELATDDELTAAWDAARDAAHAAARAAEAAAAWAAEEAAARDAAWAAAWDAAWAASLDVARDAEGATEGDAQAAEFRRRFCTEDA